MMLVGDSIMRNQWESLVCLVEAVIPPERKTVIYNGPTMAFQALVKTGLKIDKLIQLSLTWKGLIKYCRTLKLQLSSLGLHFLWS